MSDEHEDLTRDYHMKLTLEIHALLDREGHKWSTILTPAEIVAGSVTALASVACFRIALNSSNPEMALDFIIQEMRKNLPLAIMHIEAQKEKAHDAA